MAFILLYVSFKGDRSGMKVAITVWGRRISPVFDSADKLVIAEIKNAKVVNKKKQGFNPGIPSRLIKKLKQLDVAVLICGAISEIPANMIEAGGIRLIPFISGNVDDVLCTYAKEIPIVPEFLMPGCGCEQHRCRQRRCSESTIPLFQKNEVAIMPRGDGADSQSWDTGTGKRQGQYNKGKRGRGRGKGRGGKWL